MGFFKNIFNKLKGSDKEATELPADLELIPGELWVHVSIHQIPATMGNNSLNALSFVTRGMINYGQQELFFVLKTNHIGIHDVPQEPLFFFQQVYALAKQGQIAREGSITQFGEKDLWGWKGIVYAKAPVHLYKTLPKNCLSMVLLSLEEVQAVQEFGYTRILSMLGKQARYYPFPYWTDHYRENLLIREVTTNTLLRNLRRTVMPQAAVTKIGNHLYLKIEKGSELNIRSESFPTQIPIAILPSLAQECDSCLTWSFKPNAPEAITHPNSKGGVMGGCFLMLVALQDKNAAQILEDGFALMLKNEDWEGFWEAMKLEKVYEVKTEDEFMDFTLVWV